MAVPGQQPDPHRRQERRRGYLLLDLVALFVPLRFRHYLPILVSSFRPREVSSPIKCDANGFTCPSRTSEARTERPLDHSRWR